LDAIAARHQIQNTARHRAMGDVDAVLAFLNIAKLELGEAALVSAAMQLISQPSLPKHIDGHMLEDIPEAPGVYLFFGENDLPLYIGKSVNLRARVLSHFSSDHASTKEMRISQEIKRIDWMPTAGEFGALLLESQLIKSRQPIHNRQLRHERQLCTWRLAQEVDAKPLLTLVRQDEINPAEMMGLFGTFKTKRQATEVLRGLAEKHQLCPKYLGLEAWSTGPCFSYQIKRCKGVCCAKETEAIHYLRLQQALLAHHLKAWPYQGKIAIKEHNAENGLTALYVFLYWTYLGVVNNEEDLYELQSVQANLIFDLDTYKLLLKALSRAQTEVIVL
jgi:DNA polymerase-3 subunit epsilon